MCLSLGCLKRLPSRALCMYAQESPLHLVLLRVTVWDLKQVFPPTVLPRISCPAWSLGNTVPDLTDSDLFRFCSFAVDVDVRAWKIARRGRRFGLVSVYCCTQDIINSVVFHVSEQKRKTNCDDFEKEYPVSSHVTLKESSGGNGTAVVLSKRPYLATVEQGHLSRYARWPIEQHLFPPPPFVSGFHPLLFHSVHCARRSGHARGGSRRGFLSSGHPLLDARSRA